MQPRFPTSNQLDVDDVFVEGGNMGALMRSIDWSRTPLGPVSAWSQALRTTVGLLLRNRFPLLVWWGPRFVQFYNDAYAPIPGAKHPKAMGQPGSECWAEIWDIIGPMVEAPFSGQPATWSDDLSLLINRKGFLEETHFKVAYSPVPDATVQPTGVGGVLATVAETTEQVYGERQLKTLRELGARAAEAKTPERACETAASTFRENLFDVPFALLYLLEADGTRARLASSCGFATENGPANPTVIDLQAPGGEHAWPVSRIVQTQNVQIVSDLSTRFATLPSGRWSESPRQAVGLRLSSPDQSHPYGVLIAGCSPHRQLDEGYRTFFELAAAQVITAIRNANAYEEQRLRAEKLAEIDRAKTAFFSNVSHEFRTPLTLILGPLEDALGGASRTLSGDNLETTYRSALRLLKLVNALLDFSRIEAGRLQASFEPTDLSAVTIELAGVFRAAIERAGLRLIVHCDTLPEPVYVDREMWEKTVLNLLSNAFKFTFEGDIEVTLRPAGDHVELIVGDSGVGISPDQVPRVFERFHRVEGSKARTHEGSGIGLALVQELVRMHGGEIRVESEPGEGTTFAVSIPFGSSHLPNDQVAAQRAPQSTPTVAAGFAEESFRWLPAGPHAPIGDASPPPDTVAGTERARILLADDNADMRDYVARLLREQWEVHPVADGEAALAALNDGDFDLVLTDVMMPLLDGFGLLRAIKSDPRTQPIPVIMLSARAGEESQVEGLYAGADDYLIKPFSARELLARVSTHLQLGRMRKALQEERVRLIQAHRAKDEFLAMLGHELRNPLAPILTALQLMRLRNEGGERERAVIERQVRHVVSLVDDLLDISRITRGRIHLQRSRVALADVVARAVEMASPLLEQKQHELSVNVPRLGYDVDGDGDRLAQVVANLLTNAAKYTEPEGRISIEARADDETVALTVRDTGIGITSEMLPRIFDLFAQEQQALDRSQGGLGLGLAIVRSLITLHGGTVEAHSAGRGCGSEFTIRLPRLASTAVPPTPHHQPETTREASGMRVLVVDDNEDAAVMLAEALVASGFRARATHDAPSAIRIAEEFHPAVALLDIGLPVMDGYELARRFRDHPILRSARLVAITGYGQTHDRTRSQNADFDAHLVKPVDLSDLRRMLESFSASG